MKIHDITGQTHDITAQTHDITAQTHDITAQTHDSTAQIHDSTAQTHDITAQRDDSTAPTHDITAQPHVHMSHELLHFERTELRPEEKKPHISRKETIDRWSVPSIAWTPSRPQWHTLTTQKKVKRVIITPAKVILVFGFLYLFICSLDFLSSSFKLLGGKKVGQVFHQSQVLKNPLAGLMIGVLVTVLVQSSSTSTSITISMVAAEILTVRDAVPIVMGANIGTSVTNTLVSIGQITDMSGFRRAFAGATVHDTFNWMTVAVLLPLEFFTGYLFRLSLAIVDSMSLTERLDVHKDLLKTITKPFTKFFIQVSSSNIKKIATKAAEAHETTLMKFCCDKIKPEKCCSSKLKSLPEKAYSTGANRNFTQAERSAICRSVDSCVMKKYGSSATDSHLQNCLTQPWKQEQFSKVYHVNTLNCAVTGANTSEIDCCNSELKIATFFSDFDKNATAADRKDVCKSVNDKCYTSDVYDKCLGWWTVGRTDEGLGEVFSCKDWTSKVERTCNKPCKFLFRSTHIYAGGPLSDEGLGAILLVLSLILLTVCLVCMVHLLLSLLKGSVAVVIRKFVNADFPGYCGYFTGYLAILVGAGLTVLVQSSSVFTSTLTPLVGIGIITIDRMYPLTLGSNIGTTATGILAALAQDVESIPRSLQVAFCHLFINLSGILIFYPLPFFRPPVAVAKFLGRTTARYRWFAIVYLIVAFFLFPLLIFGLSTIPGWYVTALVLGPFLLLIITLVIIKRLQAKRPNWLPPKLRTWQFLPLPLRSLEPYDSLLKKMFCCGRFQQ